MNTQENSSNQIQPQEPTLKEKTAKGLFWGGISTFMQQFIGAVFGIVIARILSPDDYGLIAMLAIFTALANTIMDSGFSIALINRETIVHKDYNAVFWFNIFAGIGIYIILFFLAPLIAQFYNQPVLTNLSRIVFLSFVFAGAGIAHNAFLLKKIMAKQRGIIDMVSVLCSGIIGLILALKGFAFWGLAIQQVSQTVIAVLLRWYFSSWKPTIQFDFTPLKEMFGFSIKLFITNVFAQITSNLFSAVLGKLYGKTETGYYAQGNKWAGMSNAVITGTINSIAQPVLVEAKSDIKRQLNVFRKMIRFGAFITFPSLLGLAFVSKEFLLITVGEKWIDSVIYMQLFCIWGINGYLSSLYIMLILSHEKSAIYMNVMVVLFLTQLISLFICSPYGALLMACVYVGLYLLSTFAWQWYAQRLIGLRIKDVIMDLFPYIAATIIAIGIAWLFSMKIDNIYLKFIVKVLSTTIVYCSILWRANSVIFKESLHFLLRRKI